MSDLHFLRSPARCFFIGPFASFLFMGKNELKVTLYLQRDGSVLALHRQSCDIMQIFGPSVHYYGNNYILLLFVIFFNVMILFLARGLRVPSADRRETLPHGGKSPNLGPLSKKIRNQNMQNMQNLARFRTTSDFGRSESRANHSAKRSSRKVP